MTDKEDMMKLMDLLVLAYAPLVARFHLIDGPAASRGPADTPRMPRAKRAWLRDLRPQIARRTLGPRWRTA
ncbi:MAG TPA: hypothetical protein VFV97_10610 [Rhodanobacteraceae bacterium]|nr:hypothetical protein [Rhodanobacteraceae bacterium]